MFKNFDPNQALPLFLALIAVFIIVVAIDLVILIRWLIYRTRMEAEYAAVPGVLGQGEGMTAADYASAPQVLVSEQSATDEKAAEAETDPPLVEQAEAAQSADSAVVSVEPTEPAGEPADLQTRPLRPRSPFAPTWSLVDPFIGIQVVVVLANLLPLVGLVLYLGALYVTGSHLSPTAATERATPTIVIIGLFLQNVLFVAIVAFYLEKYGTSLSRIGLRRPTLRLIGLGLSLGLALVLLSHLAEVGFFSALQHLLPPGSLARLKKMSEPFDAGAMFQQLHSAWFKVLFILAGAVAAPIGEEVFFRGLVYNALKVRFGVVTGIIVSGLAFALIHMSPLAVFIIFPMGMILAYVYERTRSLWVTICMHAVNNGLAFILLWLFPKLGS